MNKACLPFICLVILACAPAVEEGWPPQAYFCRTENCTGLMLGYIGNASTVVCAFYDLDEQKIISALSQKGALLLVDHKVQGSELAGIAYKRGPPGRQMHHKFCVLDSSVVITGSTNPTRRGLNYNDNNLVVLKSETIAENYLREYRTIVSGKASRTRPRAVIEGVLVENYFCPRDCSPATITGLIEGAEESVFFMTFSFTNDEIGSAIARAHERGVHVEGIFEKSQASKYSEYAMLREIGVDAALDTSPYNMHHKVFIIDRETVVTGSMNPSNNGIYKNFENILIVHDADFAASFLDEFARIKEGLDLRI